MKPLAFQFKEFQTGESFDYSTIEYDHSLNLSVNKITKQPAIDELNLVTETFTRQGEVSDSDPGRVSLLMATETYTKSGEGIDSDPHRAGIGLTMATQTDTFIPAESSDSGKDRQLFYLFQS